MLPLVNGLMKFLETRHCLVSTVFRFSCQNPIVSKRKTPLAKRGFFIIIAAAMGLVFSGRAGYNRVQNHLSEAKFRVADPGLAGRPEAVRPHRRRYRRKKGAENVSGE